LETCRPMKPPEKLSGRSEERNGNALAAYPTVPPERKDWLTRTQRQEDAMAEQTTTAMKPYRGSLPRGAHVRVVLPGSGKVRGKQRGKGAALRGKDMLIYEYKLEGTLAQYTAIEEAIRIVQFIRNKCLRRWMDTQGTNGNDL
jgi:hypothetical protein